MSAGEWERRIGLADHHGTVASVTFDPADSDGAAIVQLVLSSGAASFRACPTPTALRQLAAALLDGADAMEASP